MKKVLPLLAAASLFVAAHSIHAASYADGVVNYSSGSGIFAGYDNPNAALGSPTRSYTDPYGTWGVDPFAAAYQSSELVSVGAGGSLTVSFSTAIANDPTHLYGLDFIIYGNSFLVTPGPNYDTANGQLGGFNTSVTEVSVSADGVTYYRLNPALAPVVDGFAPTDGAGDFSQPLNPSLSPVDFNGQTLAGVRSRYNGSGGGTAYDIAWAQDVNGDPVALTNVSYVRVNVLAGGLGVADIDGFSAVSSVPEPSIWALAAIGGVALFVAYRGRGVLSPALMRNDATESGWNGRTEVMF